MVEAKEGVEEEAEEEEEKKPEELELVEEGERPNALDILDSREEEGGEMARVGGLETLTEFDELTDVGDDTE